MSDVFRFVSLRPPQRAADEDVDAKLVHTHPQPADRVGLYDAVATAVDSGDRAGVEAAAVAFTRSNSFVERLDAVETKFDAIDKFLLNASDRPSPAAIKEEIKRTTGLEAARLVAGDKYARDRRRLADSLLAVALTHLGSQDSRERLLRAMVIAGLMERVADRWAVVDSAVGIHDFLRDAIVVLPAELFASQPPDGDDGAMRRAVPDRGRYRPRDSETPIDRPPEDVDDELAAIDGAIRELRCALDDVAPDTEGSWVAVPSRRRWEPTTRSSGRRDPDSVTVPLRPGSSEDAREEREERNLPAESGGTAMRPWTVAPHDVERLSRSTRGVLSAVTETERGVDIPAAIEILEYRAAELGASVAERPGTALVALGTGVVELETAVSSAAATAATPFGTGATLARQPGIADLLVVRQEIKRYEMGEIAHVENVLAGEDKQRIHRTSTMTEETLLTETSHAEELELDTQSTSRFEMAHEVASAMAEDIKFDAGVRVAGAIGPVQIAASVGFAYTHSKEESERTATSFAKETSERARSRVEDNIRELRARRTTTQVEETNRHGIDNKGETDHVVGLYRWLDKVYDAQIFNYGRRLMLEFVVPEPAAFYIHALANKPVEGITLKKPDVPTKPGTDQPLSPADITVDNYLDFVRRYEVGDVSPPPRPFVTVGLAWDEPWPQNTPDESTPAKLLYKARKEIKIPAGYKAARAAGVVYASAWRQDTYLAIGSTALRGSDGGASGESMPWTFNAPLANEEGDLPVALTVYNAWGYAISLDILCERTTDGFVKWQLTTYEAIMRAYYELKSAYESQVAAAATRAGIAIGGRNPLENRAIERIELQKSAIEMLTGQWFAGFGAIGAQPPQNYPEIDFGAAAREGPIVQFFEQAFEWVQMTYTFYPYYWGRKNGWLTLSQLTEPDPVFLSFLRAGYARVVVPVRPGFEQAMTYYLATGDIWNGGQAPQIGDPLYVSIVQEIQEQLQAPVTGVAVGDPWEVTLPTTLVMLQDDATLPTWP